MFEIVLTIAAVVTPVIVLAKLVGAGEPGTLASMFAPAQNHNAWPRGVQEEDPKPWNLGATVPAGA